MLLSALHRKVDGGSWNILHHFYLVNMKQVQHYTSDDLKFSPFSAPGLTHSVNTRYNKTGFHSHQAKLLWKVTLCRKQWSKKRFCAKFKQLILHRPCWDRCVCLSFCLYWVAVLSEPHPAQGFKSQVFVFHHFSNWTGLIRCSHFLLEPLIFTFLPSTSVLIAEIAISASILKRMFLQRSLRS